MSQSPYDIDMAVYPNTQDDIPPSFIALNDNTLELGSYKNLWFEKPFKLMLKLVKQHLPNIENTAINIEERRNIWKFIKDQLDAAGYHFSILQIQKKYQSIEKYRKIPEDQPITSFRGNLPELEKEINTQNSKQPRGSKSSTTKSGNKFAEMNDLLESWGLSELKSKFKANYIVMQALEYLTEADIIELIPKIGQRAIFRAKLNQWRQEKLSSTSNTSPSTSTAPPPTPAVPQINVPEPKKIKIEPGLEVKSMAQLQQPFEVKSMAQLQQPFEPQMPQLLPMQSLQPNGAPKMNPILPTLTPRPRARRINKKNNIQNNTQINNQNNNQNNAPTIQSRVQQFFIGSSPPPTTTTTATPTSTGTGIGTGICRLPIPPSPNHPSNGPRLTLVNPISSPSMFYNIPSQLECRRFPNTIIRAVGPANPTPPTTQVHSPVPTTPIRVIKSDNLSTTPNSMQFRVPTSEPNFNADLTPFATSIIRVETNCETQYPSNGSPSPQNPITKLKRTTIIQKLKADNKISPTQQQGPRVSKPLIMPKPLLKLQKAPTRVAKAAPVVSKSIEVPKPKPFLIPKIEPLDEEEHKDEDKETMDWNDFCEARKKSGKLASVEIQTEPEPEPEPQPEPEPEQEEMEFDPESNPEVEEFTLADAVEIPDHIKDELLDSDTNSHSDHDQDKADGNEKDELLKAMPSPKDSQDSQDTQYTQDTQDSKGDLQRLDIRKILMTSKSGRQVIKRYVAEEILDNPRRKLLTDTIAQYCFDNKIHITPTFCKDIAEEIIEIFPNERMEDYFVRKGKKLRPPIYVKFHAIRREFSRQKAAEVAETYLANKSTNSKIKESKRKSSSSNKEKEMEYDDDDNLIIS